MQTPEKRRTIDEEVDRMLIELKGLSPDSKEYESVSKNLETICRARSLKPSTLVNWDTIILASTNILGILLVLNYEQLHVVTSKAISFVGKGRV